MAAWHFYFLAKLLLHARGNLRINPLLSGALLAFVVIPVPKRLSAARAALAWAAAAALAWHESWLPPPRAIVEFLSDPTGTATASYLLEFFRGAVSVPLLLELAALAGAVAWAARRGLRLSFLAALGLAAVAVLDPGSFQLDAVKRELDAFYRAEEKRAVKLGRAAEPPFDVILLHVCSLSWDDLDRAGLRDDPFVKGSQAVLTRFNAATSYSNPAAIRLLRAPCGQRPHDAIFRPLDDGCYLLDGLRAAGYKTWAAANHDGRYSAMGESVRVHGRADAFAPVDGLPVAKLNFDGTRIHDDGAVLERWWRERQASGAARAALYYNTISLHQGTRRPGQASEWAKDRPGQYRKVAGELFATLERFFAGIRASGRRALVLIVAEHGAALAGSALQAPDLRDIPLPELTRVPVLVKVVGPGAPPAAGLAVDNPVSYLALAELVRRALAKPPFGAALDVAGLPETRPLSENQHARVLESGGRLLVEQDGAWKSLASGR